MTLKNNIRVNLERYASTLKISHGVGVGRENGLARLALTDADKEMRDIFVSWCEAAGLQMRVDAVGNIFGRRSGTSALSPVVIGSHLDTQANGGRFDGIVGVLGGLEVIRTLNDHSIQTKHPIEVVNWANEEGARFSPPMVASGTYVGAYDLDWVYSLRSDDGATYGAELERIGYKGTSPVTGHDMHAYFELHIEQGDELEKASIQVGVVTYGHSSHGMVVEFTGETAHSGTFPMEKRRNALVAAARMLVSVDDLGQEYASSGGKATAARLVAWPNKTGTLSDWASAIADVRHEDPGVAKKMRNSIFNAAEQAAMKAACDFKVVDEWSWGGRIFDEGLVQRVRGAASSLGYSHIDLPSHAGHDAYFIAKKFPAAMIFTPCVGGVSHNNQEDVAVEDIEPGLNVLLHAVYSTAND